MIVEHKVQLRTLMSHVCTIHMSFFCRIDYYSQVVNCTPTLSTYCTIKSRQVTSCNDHAYVEADHQKLIGVVRVSETMKEEEP